MLSAVGSLVCSGTSESERRGAVRHKVQQRKESRKQETFALLRAYAKHPLDDSTHPRSATMVSLP